MLLQYDLTGDVLAFTAGKGCHGTEPGIDARETGVRADGLEISAGQLMIPRQTHSVNVAWVDGPGEVPDTDAVITRKRELCLAVKTADCIPVLLYDEAQQMIAAVHAGWRGTVGRIVERTIREMGSKGEDLYAIIGPGISLDAFEIGDEVYDTFSNEGFPMERIARRYPDSKNAKAQKWHIDLWDANRWLLEQQGVTRIHTAGICTYNHNADYYSARQETIKTGRNINGIMLL